VGIEFVQGTHKSGHIFRGSLVEDIEIEGDDRGPLKYGSETAHHDEIDMILREET
jgi:hypothetical protein